MDFFLFYGKVFIEEVSPADSGGKENNMSLPRFVGFFSGDCSEFQISPARPVHVPREFSATVEQAEKWLAENHRGYELYVHQERSTVLRGIPFHTPAEDNGTGVFAIKPPNTGLRVVAEAS